MCVSVDVNLKQRCNVCCRFVIYGLMSVHMYHCAFTPVRPWHIRYLLDVLWRDKKENHFTSIGRGSALYVTDCFGFHPDLPLCRHQTMARKVWATLLNDLENWPFWYHTEASVWFVILKSCLSVLHMYPNLEILSWKIFLFAHFSSESSSSTFYFPGRLGFVVRGHGSEVKTHCKHVYFS